MGDSDDPENKKHKREKPISEKEDWRNRTGEQTLNIVLEEKEKEKETMKVKNQEKEKQILKKMNDETETMKKHLEEKTWELKVGSRKRKSRTKHNRTKS